MIRVEVKLNASLRRYDENPSNHGLVRLELNEGVTVQAAMGRLGIPLQKVKMVLLNGKGALFDSVLSNGDRIALFPPEMAFNMYVAISFRRDLTEKNAQWEGRIDNRLCEADGKPSRQRSSEPFRSD